MAELDPWVEARRYSTAGPFLRLLRRLHLIRADGSPRATALVAIAWLPLCAGALLSLAVHREPASILFDVSVHTRLLIVIPLVIHAERLLERRRSCAIYQFYRDKLADRTSLDRITLREERLRESGLAELAIIALAVGLGQAALWGLVGPTGVFAGVAQAGTVSFARLWYVTVGLPIVQFIGLRWLWHWFTWSYFVVRVSRMTLATIATHPDHAGGIGVLGSPVTAFAGFVLAAAAMLGSAWGTQILDGRATVQTFAPSFAAFLALAVVVGCGPLLLFSGMLYRVRHRDIVRYNGLALDYAREFDRKWIDAPRAESLLGTPDLQSMADLHNTYEGLLKIRLIPIEPRAIVSIWVAAVIPMIPIIMTAMPLTDMAKHVGRALLGGLPV